MNQFVRDLVYSVRNLRKSPSFTLTAGVALAIGIGLNIMLFMVVKSVLLDSLRFPNPRTLVMLHESIPKYQMVLQPLSTIEFGAIRANAKSYAALGAFESAATE